MVWLGWTLKPWISWFFGAGTCCDGSVIALNTIWVSVGLSKPYHFGLGTRTVWVSLSYELILNAPPDQVGWAYCALNPASRPASVVRSPALAAMCAGYRPVNRPFQSGYGFL